MSRLMLLVGFLMCGTASAADYLDGYVSESKALAFLAKEKPCYFWMAFAPNDRRLGPDATMPRSVLCFFNGTLDERTVNETKGCVMSHYRLDLGSHTPPSVTGKFESEPGPCTQDKVRKMMSRLPTGPGAREVPEINATVWIASTARIWEAQRFRSGGTGPSARLSKSIGEQVCGGTKPWDWWKKVRTALDCRSGDGAPLAP